MRGGQRGDRRDPARRGGGNADADHGEDDALVVRALVGMVMPADPVAVMVPVVMVAEVEMDLLLRADDPRKLERNQRREGEQPCDPSHRP